MSSPAEQEVYPGDDLIPSPQMHYNETRLIHASPSQIYPWLLQLGKGRGGWYLPSFYENIFLPSSWRATRSINPAWQTLSVGDRIPDYGFSDDDFFDVRIVDPPKAIVFTSERYGCKFSWAMLLHEVADGLTEVRLRFRGRIEATGLKRAVIVRFGAFMDHISTAPMLAGLAERCTKPLDRRAKSA